MTSPLIVALIVQLWVSSERSMFRSRRSTSMILEFSLSSMIPIKSEIIVDNLGNELLYYKITIVTWRFLTYIWSFLPISLIERWWCWSIDNWSTRSKNLTQVMLSSLLSVSDSELSSPPKFKKYSSYIFWKSLFNDIVLDVVIKIAPNVKRLYLQVSFVTLYSSQSAFVDQYPLRLF